jgi:hypothetical protein
MIDTDDPLFHLAHLADACEQSWSLTADEIEERVLFFCDAGVEAAQHIARAAQSLAMDDSLLADWSLAMRGADAIGMAVRCDRQSVRLYTQYWEAIADRVKNGDHSPYPLYCGFKSLPGGVVRRDEYIAFPAAEPALFWPPMAKSFAGFGLDKSEGERVFSGLSASTAIFTLTSGNGRKSWLTTVRRADIDRVALAGWLAPLANRPGGGAILEAARNNDLVHLAGGVDDVKGTFLTVYFEVGAETLLSRLS